MPIYEKTVLHIPMAKSILVLAERGEQHGRYEKKSIAQASSQEN